MALADKRDYDRALADYDQALKLDPKYALAHLNRGLLWHAASDYDRAIADFDHGDPPRARQRGGRQRPRHHARRQGRVRPRASPISTAPSRSNPTTPTYYDNRGNVWRNRGRFDRAIEDYDKAIALAPGFAFAFYNRSQAHYLAGRFTEALADAGKAAALNENSASALEPARADPREARRAGRRHRRSAAGRGARPELAAGRSTRCAGLGETR